MENKDKIIDAIIVGVIALIGIFTAVVTFGILKSQAQGEIGPYQVGGAIAGALVSWSLLASLYLQIRKSSNEPEKLREQIKAEEQKFQEQIGVLQQKILRGSPCPAGFIAEISEQQKIVLARPEKWHKRGGMMFDVEMVEMKQDDQYPARFTCSFVPITSDYEKLGMDGFYDVFEENIRLNPYNYYTRCEYIYIGGDQYHAKKSIKLIARQHMRLEFYANPYGGKNRMESSVVSEREYTKHTGSAAPPNAGASDESDGLRTSQEVRVNGRDPVEVKYVEISHMFVACYREELKKVFFFEFMDDEKDFGRTSEIFNQVLTSTRFL
jgi:hypothetical protein